MTTDTSGTAPERPAGTENETASSPAASGPQAPNAAGEQDVVAKELAEAKDRLLRTLAEMENLRRRTEREVVDARLYGIANFARDMLGIADNIHRALEAAGLHAIAHARMAARPGSTLAIQLELQTQGLRHGEAVAQERAQACAIPQRQKSGVQR